MARLRLEVLEDSSGGVNVVGLAGGTRERRETHDVLARHHAVDRKGDRV